MAATYCINKCFLFRIANTHMLNNCTHTYHVNGCALPLVDRIRDLGVIVDSRLKFDKHIALIVHKAMSRCRLILKCFHSRNATIMLQVYVTYIHPNISVRNTKVIDDPSRNCSQNRTRKNSFTDRKLH